MAMAQFPAGPRCGRGRIRFGKSGAIARADRRIVPALRGGNQRSPARYHGGSA